MWCICGGSVLQQGPYSRPRRRPIDVRFAKVAGQYGTLIPAHGDKGGSNSPKKSFFESRYRPEPCSATVVDISRRV